MFHFEFLVTFTIYNIPKLIINKHVFQTNIIFLKNRSRVFQISNDINRSINHRWQHFVPINKYFINAVKYNYFLIWQQNFSKNNSIRALTLLKRESLHRYNIKIAISIRGMKHLISTLHTRRIHLDASIFWPGQASNLPVNERTATCILIDRDDDIQDY